jgi:hypothetical protein
MYVPHAAIIIVRVIAPAETSYRVLMYVPHAAIIIVPVTAPAETSCPALMFAMIAEHIRVFV